MGEFALLNYAADNGAAVAAIKVGDRVVPLGAGLDALGKPGVIDTS